MKTYVNEIVFRDDLRAVGAGIITLSGINGSNGISNSNGITSTNQQSISNNSFSLMNGVNFDITSPFRTISNDVLGYNNWELSEWKNPWTGTNYQSLNGSMFQTQVPEFVEGEGWILNGDTMNISRFAMGALDMFSPANLIGSALMALGIWGIDYLINKYKKNQAYNLWKSKQGGQGVW